MDWSSFSIGNAAGFTKGQDRAFDEMLRSAATEITVGSITVGPRDGNPGTTYRLTDDGTSINALGLPNPGLAATEKVASVMASQARAYEKQLRWSVAGFSPDEYAELVFRLAPHGMIELNLGCPNVWGGDTQKPIASFNLELMDEILRKVARISRQLQVKLSPYSDPMLIVFVADVMQKYRESIKAVVVCNTFPNGVAVEDTRRVLSTPNGYGGIGGNAMHLIALGQVSQFVAALEGSGIAVIGAGGVNSGERLTAMRAVGASGVQIGTAFGERGGKIFSQILQEATGE